MDSFIFSFGYSSKFRLEKPGVSTKEILFTTNISVCLVVCFPRFSALDISSVFKFKLGASLFISVLFPAPLWPVKTTVFPCKYFSNFSCSSFLKQVIPISS